MPKGAVPAMGQQRPVMVVTEAEGASERGSMIIGLPRQRVRARIGEG